MIRFILNLIKKMFRKKVKTPVYYYENEFIVGYTNISDD
tara:strand:- start:5222 stop:5338 length:117 start_codon:yes stop_codon:yes gene_type:complete